MSIPCRVAVSAPAPVFAKASPLGLPGLAIGCAALRPIAFGWSLTPAALRTAAIFCLLFGGGWQMLAGLMALANRNATRLNRVEGFLSGALLLSPQYRQR